jgi:hypothetical protein
MIVQKKTAKKCLRFAIPTFLSLALGCGSGPRSSLKLVAPGEPLRVNSPNQIRAILVGQNEVNQDVTDSVRWIISGESASIDKGAITCHKPGSLSIHASLDELETSATLSCAGQNVPVISDPPSAPSPFPSGSGPNAAPNDPPVTVPNPSVIGVAFHTTPKTVRSEDPYQFKILAIYSDGTTSDQTSNAIWSVDSNIAHISPTGLALCNLAGTATVTAQLYGHSTSASFACTLRRVTPMAGFGDHAQTFDGPFASWINVKTAFGAKGDGVTDDTQALQAALNSIQGQPGVLWLPEGTYVISSTLRLRAAQEFTIIGEEPRSTVIEWHGPVGGTMLSLEGCAWFRLARLWWDGKDRAGVGIHIASTLSDGENYPTFDTLEDQKLSHVGMGLEIGFAGETTVQRVTFDHNTVAGISLEDWNALNFNVVDSLFVDCAIGVTNYYGSGAFNVSNSVFIRSTAADMMMGNTGPFSERQNISVDSKAFFVAGQIGAGANVILQANTIIHPTQTPIQISNPGPITVLDNQFLQLDPSLNILSAPSGNKVGVFAMGNQFAVPIPYSGNFGQIASIDESPYPSDQESAPPIPADVYIPAPSHRPVFEVPKSAVSSVIQAIVDSAASLPDAVIHFSGSYLIDQTIVVSGTNHVVLTGDGPTTLLRGTTQLSGPVLQVTGNKVQLENLTIAGASNQTQNADLELDVDDKPSTSIHCDQCKTFFSPIAFQAIGLDHASVDFRIGAINADNYGASIGGGPTRRAGNLTLGRIDAFMTSIDAYTVGDGGHFLVEDGWHDVGQGSRQFDLTGSVEVTHQGGSIYTSNNGAAMTSNQLSGKVSILGVITDSHFKTSAGDSANVAVAGTLQTTGDHILFKNLASTGQITQRINLASTNNYTPLPLADSAQTGADIEGMFGQTRTEYVAPRLANTIDGSTNIGLHRVLLTSSTIGLLVAPKHPQSTPYYSITPSLVLEKDTEGTGSCSTGIALGGKWTLEFGDDGFFGLKNNGQFLSEAVPDSVLTLSSLFAYAGQRWSAFPVGDGTFIIVNRASGKVLTRDMTGCAYLDHDEAIESQHWRLEPVN